MQPFWDSVKNVLKCHSVRNIRTYMLGWLCYVIVLSEQGRAHYHFVIPADNFIEQTRTFAMIKCIWWR